MDIVRLSPASPTADLRALQEVSGFASTDMGWGGDDRWTYRMLAEEQITPEILRLSDHGTRGNIDYVSLQPCTSYETRSQDRFDIQSWDLPGGRWTFSGVFDGHGAHATVDYVVEHLPARVRSTLYTALAGGTASSSTISSLLSEAIIDVDHAITREFQRLFPGGRESFSKLTDQQIASAMKSKGGAVSRSALRCMQGSTALITLVDPSGTNLWVANLGDCRAVLVSKSPAGCYSARRVTEVHNGGNAQELRRIRGEHRGERECIVEDRVLGFLAPTRALGDTWMKLPSIYSRRALIKTHEFWAAGLSEKYIERLLTPPYVSNVPQVLHHRLRKGNGRSHHPRHNPARSNVSSGSSGEADGYEDVALLLCSDGLVDLYEDQDFEENYYIKRWAAMIGEALSPAPPSSGASNYSSVTSAFQNQSALGRNGSRGGGNMAVHILRDAIGGDDLSRASANLTVEMDERWMDDTTILVHSFL